MFMGFLNWISCVIKEVMSIEVLIWISVMNSSGFDVNKIYIDLRKWMLWEY